MPSQIQNELTQAAIALAALPTNEVAKRCDSSERSVRLWKKGRLPNANARAAIEREFGIKQALFFLKAPEPAAMRAPGRVLSAAELAQTKSTTETIRAILARNDITDTARSLLSELGNSLARDVLRTECPRYAPALSK